MPLLAFSTFPILGVVFMALFEGALLLASRLLALIIVPAQLPGDVMGLLDALSDAPLATLRALSSRQLLALCRQLVSLAKLSLAEDPQLERLYAIRRRFEARGWLNCTVRTADGLALDAMRRPAPCESHGAPSQFGADGTAEAEAARYVLFLGGNFQKYEDWLPYFDLYARDARVGFLCFNFRGVGRSEGAVVAPSDLLADVGACVELLLARGVRARHILLHGFSLGGAVGALFLGAPGAPRCAFTSDRSFTSLRRAAFALLRGAREARGAPPPDAARPVASGSPALLVGGASRGGAIAKLLPRLVSAGRAVAAAAACAALRACGWELRAEEAFARIPGRRVLLYHREDSVIDFDAASLYRWLERRGHAAAAGLEVIEVERMGANGWPTHDFPLCADKEVWQKMIRAERAALGMDADDEKAAAGGGESDGAASDGL
ncbi:hypothetical protein AB1Y20_018478 [Prymnesium parvum]|uniref:AB hydrolase-1 domain-containing protein n=1 Tax=Prymnesium parvum TaxID=97485 RepID=A0AB34JQ15_PRYPA